MHALTAKNKKLMEHSDHCGISYKLFPVDDFKMSVVKRACYNSNVSEKFWMFSRLWFFVFLFCFLRLKGFSCERVQNINRRLKFPSQTYIPLLSIMLF